MVSNSSGPLGPELSVESLVSDVSPSHQSAPSSSNASPIKNFLVLVVSATFAYDVTA